MELDGGVLLLYYILSILATISVLSIFVTLFVAFSLYGNRATVKKSKHTFFATGSMVAFYGLYFTVMQLGWGGFRYVYDSDAAFYINTALIISATALVVAGAIINLSGRLQLKDNWANQIKIYEGQTLVTGGIYKTIRHPLYTSLILLFIGGSLAYKNLLCAALTAFVFFPSIYYRAKQEELLLCDEFTEYSAYMEKTGMFFPKINLHRSGQ